MVNFCNPGVLGSPAEFRKYFEAPILQGREPNSTADQAQLGLERSEELSAKVNHFILRRTNALLSAHLPPKVRCSKIAFSNIMWDALCSARLQLMRLGEMRSSEGTRCTWCHAKCRRLQVQ